MAELNSEDDKAETDGVECVDTIEEEAEVKGEKKTQLNLNFDHYLAGGSIGFSVAMIMMLVLDWAILELGQDKSIPVQIFLSFFPSLVGGALGSFLFTRRTRRKYYEDGLKMGVSGIVITMIYTLLLSVRVGGMYIILGFLGGGLLGGYLSKNILLNDRINVK